jgi:hypothetical protein
MFILFLQHVVSSGIMLVYNPGFFSFLPWSDTDLLFDNLRIAGTQLFVQNLLALAWMLPMIT